MLIVRPAHLRRSTAPRCAHRAHRERPAPRLDSRNARYVCLALIKTLLDRVFANLALKRRFRAQLALFRAPSVSPAQSAPARVNLRVPIARRALSATRRAPTRAIRVRSDFTRLFQAQFRVSPAQSGSIRTRWARLFALPVRQVLAVAVPFHSPPVTQPFLFPFSQVPINL